MKTNLHLAVFMLMLTLATGCAMPPSPGVPPTAPVVQTPPLIPSPTSTVLSTPTKMITPQPTPIPTHDPTRPELRAFWVDAFHPGIKSPQEIDQLVRDLQAAHANAVFAQVRKRGDAYFNLTIEPRAAELSRLPDFDPLADLIQKAHAAQPPIEVHAWLVVMPIARQGDLPTDPRHVYLMHGPDAPGDEQWTTRALDGSTVAENSYFLDPGHPAAAQYLVNIITNLVKQYAVDGVHLDYIRYAGSQWGYNPVSLRRFLAATGRTVTPAPTDTDWQQWRRDQVTNLMRQVYLESIAINPRVKVSAATIAWGAGPTSDAQWRASRTMTDTFQDWLAWMKEGIVDVALPMNYDREGDANQKKWFDQWVAWEKDHAAGRHLVIGLGAYLNDIEGTLAQAQRALVPSAQGNAAQGVSFYSYAATNAFDLSWERFARDLTAELFPANVPIPEMPWKTHPAAGYLKGAAFINGTPADGALVTLTGPAQRTLTVSGTGFFGAVNLPPGEYSAVLTVGGQTRASAKVVVEAGKVAELKLQ